VREEGCNELVRVCVSELLDCREQLQREGETDQAAQAKKTVADAATPKPEDKGLSEQATDALPAKASDTAASVTDSAKSSVSLSSCCCSGTGPHVFSRWPQAPGRCIQL
jgi:hypothetical protein